MIPTMQIGDFIFVNKFLYGVRVPYTRTKLFEVRKPKEAAVISEIDGTLSFDGTYLNMPLAITPQNDLALNFDGSVISVTGPPLMVFVLIRVVLMSGVPPALITPEFTSFSCLVGDMQRLSEMM